LIDKDIIILGIESSCDDTSAAVLKNEQILSNLIAGQKVHESFGGVVPELASRAHQQNIVPVVDQAIKQAGISKNDIDAVAFTRGPGLLGSLIVGTSFAKAFSLGMGIPMVDVNHMKGHILAHFIDDPEREKPDFPFICLTVSGGHTQLVLVNDYDDMEVVGSTMDDAAGEAFDKTAKLLGLPYPGGPIVDKYAREGDSSIVSFSKPQVPGFDYSFSGLKTNVIQVLQKANKQDPDFVKNNIKNICASLQETIMDILFDKLIKAMRHFNIEEVAIAGGVSANSALRERLKETGEKYGWRTHIPRFEYCTDNAAMIAIAGRYQYLQGNFADQSVSASARLKV